MASQSLALSNSMKVKRIKLLNEQYYFSDEEYILLVNGVLSVGQLYKSDIVFNSFHFINAHLV